MKKTLLTIALLLYWSISYAQWRLSDYETNSIVTIDSVTYKIEAPFKGLINHEQNPDKKTGFLMSPTSNKWNDIIGQYKNGELVTDPLEVHDIIIPQAFYKIPIYGAVRAAFSKEKELIPHHDWTIYLFVIVDSQGNIIETSTGFSSTKNYVIQPKQIAILESTIRKNLKFEVTQKAKQFNFFEAQIVIYFQHFIEDMLEAEFEPDAKAFGEEDDNTVPVYGDPSSSLLYP